MSFWWSDSKSSTVGARSNSFHPRKTLGNEIHCECGYTTTAISTPVTRARNDDGDDASASSHLIRFGNSSSPRSFFRCILFFPIRFYRCHLRSCKGDHIASTIPSPCTVPFRRSPSSPLLFSYLIILYRLYYSCC